MTTKLNISKGKNDRTLHTLREKAGLTQAQMAERLGITAETFIEELKEIVLPQSELGKAVSYALNQWPSIQRYAEAGEAEIDNNSCENTIRGVAVGRKNWLFCGSESGGKRAAILYSLIESCKRLGIEPYAYLQDVIERVSTHPMSRIRELTPKGYKEARREESENADFMPDLSPAN